MNGDNDQGWGIVLILVLAWCSLLGAAFRGWSQAVDKVCQQTLADGVEELAQQLAGLRGENERLRRDNERFVRLIDSGDWGRGRVAELTQAGQLIVRQHLSKSKACHVWTGPHTLCWILLLLRGDIIAMSAHAEIKRAHI